MSGYVGLRYVVDDAQKTRAAKASKLLEKGWTLSASQHRKFTDCAMCWYRTYVLKETEPPQWHFAEGHAIHLGAEKAWQQQIDLGGKLDARVWKEWALWQWGQEAAPLIVGPVGESRDALVRRRLPLMVDALMPIVSKFSPYATELKRYVSVATLGGVEYRAVSKIDQVYFDEAMQPGGVLDLKTESVGAVDLHSVQSLKQKVQGRLYGAAVMDWLERDTVPVTFVSVTKEAQPRAFVATVEMTLSDRQSVMAEMFYLAKDIALSAQLGVYRVGAKCRNGCTDAIC